MRSPLLIISLATAVALAACGSSSGTTGHSVSAPVTSAPASTASTASTPAANSTTGPTAQSTAPATTSTQTQAATPARCVAGELSASFLGGQAATGHGLLGFALHNISGHTCVAFGYPGVQFLTRSGQPLPTVPTHTTEDFFGSLTNHPLSVAPGATVSFRLGVTHGAASSAGCATAYALQVIPPNDTSTLRISIPNGAYECQATTVSPMEAGTSAYP